MRKNVKFKIYAILMVSMLSVSGCANNNGAGNESGNNQVSESEFTTNTNENFGTFNRSEEENDSILENKQEESILNENVNTEKTSDREESTTKQSHITSQTSVTTKNEETEAKTTQTVSHIPVNTEKEVSESGKQDIASQVSTTKQVNATTRQETTTKRQETTTTRQIQVTTTKRIETVTTQKPQKPTETATREFGSAVEQGRVLYTKYLSYLQEVLKYTNEIRASVGVQPLVLDETLSIAASGRSAEMDYYNYFAHTRPDGSSCFNILDEVNAKWNYVGENIAWGYSTPKAVVESWKNSPGHYENIVNPNFKKLGVGLSKEYQGRTYWTQIFTN